MPGRRAHKSKTIIIVCPVLPSAKLAPGVFTQTLFSRTHRSHYYYYDFVYFCFSKLTSFNVKFCRTSALNKSSKLVGQLLIWDYCQSTFEQPSPCDEKMPTILSRIFRRKVSRASSTWLKQRPWSVSRATRNFHENFQRLLAASRLIFS